MEDKEQFFLTDRHMCSQEERGDLTLPSIYSDIYLALCWFPGIQRNRVCGRQGQHQGMQWMRVVVRTAGKKAGEAGRAAALLPAHTKVANSSSSQVMVHGSSLGPWQRCGLAPFPWHLWRACHA